MLTNTLQQKFQNAIEISLNPHIYNLCINFAKNVNSTTCYNDCGQNDLSKKELDNIVGKLGEWGTYGALMNIGKSIGDFSISYPDMAIYTSSNKSWESDFVIKHKSTVNRIAVKSQEISQAKRFGFSGTFQIASNRKDSVFTHPNELVFLCLVDVNKDTPRVLILPPKTVSEIKFSEPALAKYKDFKTCYYAKENFDNDLLDYWVSSFVNHN